MRESLRVRLASTIASGLTPRADTYRWINGEAIYDHDIVIWYGALHARREPRRRGAGASSGPNWKPVNFKRDRRPASLPAFRHADRRHPTAGSSGRSAARLAAEVRPSQPGDTNDTRSCQCILRRAA